jgi:ribosome-binding factor A
VSTRRNERLSEEIREDVARIVGQLKDPRIGFVTVTRVELTPDLRTAHVHVGILGGGPDREKTLTGLRKAAGFVRRELGRRLHVRHTPEIAFHYDEGLDATDRVARLLDEVRPAAEAKAGDEAGDEAGDDTDDGAADDGAGEEDDE